MPSAGALKMALSEFRRVVVSVLSLTHLSGENLSCHLDNGKEEVMDVVVDLVAGPQWPKLIDVLKHGERYAVAGGIAGPIIRLEIRTLYLKDLNFFGCTFQEDIVFENHIR